jgi:hypothetical protein
LENLGHTKKYLGWVLPTDHYGLRVRRSYDEILSVQQVTSFFSRINKQNKYLEDDVEARRAIEIDKIRQEILNE